MLTPRLQELQPEPATTPSDPFEAKRIHKTYTSAISKATRSLANLQRVLHTETGEANPWLHQLSPYLVTRIRTILLNTSTKPRASAAMVELSRFIKLGISAGAIRVNPLPLVTWMIKTESRMTIITNNQWQTLEHHTKQEGLVVELRTALAYYLGLRHSEIFSLKVGWINLEKGTLETYTRKTRSAPNEPPKRTLPIPEFLRPVLTRALQTLSDNTQADHRIFTRLPRSSGQGREKTLLGEQGWTRAKKRAGLDHVRFHDLRHTFATRMHEAGATTHDLMQALGHRSEESVARYVHPDTERIRRFIK